MTWKYALKKKQLKANKILPVEDWYEVCELYGEDSYTSTPLVLSGESPKEIILMLKMILLDLENPKIIDIKKDEK